MVVVACGIWPTMLSEGVCGIYIGNLVCVVVIVRVGVFYIFFGDYLMSVIVMGGS